MNRYIAVLLFLFASVKTFAQPDWQFEAKIEKSTYYLLEGTIADKYPITMFLEVGNHYDTKDRNRWNYAYQLKGWYYYNNYKIKLPLIGVVKYVRTHDDAFYGTKINLYVPTNETDSIDIETCDLENFREIFVAEINDGQIKGFSLESSQWKTNNSKSFLPVKLKEVRRPSLETKAFISLYSKEIEIFSFDLTDNLKDLKDTYGVSIGGNYIESIELKSSKKIDNDFYLIFSFSQPTVPYSNGFGHCGAGYEDYLGFLHINSFGEKEFKYVQTDSCLGEILEEYIFDTDAPEKGIMRKSNE
jgi:hypothetical protein